MANLLRIFFYNNRYYFNFDGLCFEVIISSSHNTPKLCPSPYILEPIELKNKLALKEVMVFIYNGNTEIGAHV